MRLTKIPFLPLQIPFPKKIGETNSEHYNFSETCTFQYITIQKTFEVSVKHFFFKYGIKKNCFFDKKLKLKVLQAQIIIVTFEKFQPVYRATPCRTFEVSENAHAFDPS